MIIEIQVEKLVKSRGTANCNIHGYCESFFLLVVAYQLLNASNSLHQTQKKGKGRGESVYFVNV